MSSVWGRGLRESRCKLFTQQGLRGGVLNFWVGVSLPGGNPWSARRAAWYLLLPEKNCVRLWGCNISCTRAGQKMGEDVVEKRLLAPPWARMGRPRF